MSLTGKVVAVIPARFASTRLPGKPLADIHGKPMIQWVHDQIRKAKKVDQIIVATDDVRIMRAVQTFGGQAFLTSPELPSGTDRVAAVADRMEGDIFLNVQGDEPMMDPAAIDAAVQLVVSGRFELSTIMTPLRTLRELEDLSVVKVIVDRLDRAIYFSRYPIPYSRGPTPNEGVPFACRRHVGLYCFTRRMLHQFRELAPSALERAESLEQLRAIENGISMGIQEVDFQSIGVDTAEDLERVRRLLG